MMSLRVYRLSHSLSIFFKGVRVSRDVEGQRDAEMRSLGDSMTKGNEEFGLQEMIGDFYN